MLEQYLFLLPIATLLLIGAMTPGPHLSWLRKQPYQNLDLKPCVFL